MIREATKEPIEVEVRAIRAEDLEDVIRIDAKNSGAPRRDYFRLKLAESLDKTSVRVSLAAVHDRRVVGFLLASVFYGDFGILERTANLEAIGVLPELAGQGVGRALWRQLALNLKGMRIERVETQVDWRELDLLGFFHQLGFAPASRLCLERRLDLEAGEDEEGSVG